MSKRALFNVTVAGTNITTALMPVLLGLQVSDKVGTHTDSADLEIDDTDGRIVLPQIGAPVSIALGWESEGLRVVFEGSVDEVKSAGTRSAGRRLRITAKGMDTGLLHIGGNGGRATFKGLRRIAKASAPVATSIVAQNELIVQQ